MSKVDWSRVGVAAPWMLGAVAGALLGGFLAANLMFVATRVGELGVTVAFLAGVTAGGVAGGLLAGWSRRLIAAMGAGPPSDDVRRAGRATRMAIAAAGAVLALAFAQPGESKWVTTSGVLPSIALLPLGILGAALAAMAVAAWGVIGARRGWPLGESRWNDPSALAGAAALFGVGAGMLGGWAGAVDDDWLVAYPLALTPLVLTLAIVERGSLSMLSLLAALTLGTAFAAGHTWLIDSFGSSSSWNGSLRRRLEDALIVCLLTDVVAVVAFLGIRGLVTAHHPPRLAASLLPGLPVEVLAREGGYVVVVEAAGADTPAAVDARTLDPRRLRVRITRKPGDPAQSLWSTRPRGTLEVDVPLPVPVEEGAVHVEVEHGLVRVLLTPVAPRGTE